MSTIRTKLSRYKFVLRNKRLAIQSPVLGSHTHPCFADTRKAALHCNVSHSPTLARLSSSWRHLGLFPISLMNQAISRTAWASGAPMTGKYTATPRQACEKLIRKRTKPSSETRQKLHRQGTIVLSSQFPMSRASQPTKRKSTRRGNLRLYRQQVALSCEIREREPSRLRSACLRPQWRGPGRDAKQV